MGTAEKTSLRTVTERTDGQIVGRTAVVTGGAKGIGRHYSRALAAEGAAAVIVDIADGGSLAQELAAKVRPQRRHERTCYVSDEVAVRHLIWRVIDRFGKIDVLVSNAALYATLPEQNVTEVDVDTWDKVMAVNPRGSFLMAKHTAPHMIARRCGKIINIGSGTAFRGIPSFLHYVTRKSDIMAFTRALSRELGQHGICVNTLAPGFTLSDSIVEQTPGHVNTVRERAVQGRAIHRDQYPHNLTGTLIFLASADSDFATGQTLAVDCRGVNT